MGNLSRRLSLFALLMLGIAAAGCEVGEEAVPFEDVEAGLLILEGDELDDELVRSPIRVAEGPFVRLGFMFDAEEPGMFEVATSANGTDWSEWLTPSVHHEEVEDTTNFVGQLAVAGDQPARYYRLRGTPGAVTFIRMELLSFTQEESAESGAEDPSTAIARSVGGVEVNTRAQWGARAANCSSSLGTVTRMAIHHTETPTIDTMTPEARLRQIQAYHMDVKGWCDIGYHYLMSRDGRLWDGRPDTKLGAHAGGANTGNIGISVMGSHDATPITQAQIDSIAKLIRALADKNNVAITRAKIKGHREYKPTTCPGNALYAQLEKILDTAKGVDNGGGGSTCGALPTDGPWMCGGLTGTTTNANGKYYTTSFGCWVDENGVNHSDSGDNCIPACSLASIGCAGKSGPACERYHNWFAADADRFGCGARVRVTNPENNKSAVLIVIDRGPNCTIENSVDFWVLDMSYPASNYLFGGPTSAGEQADVQVEVVAATTPLGPTSGASTCGGGGGMTGTAILQGVIYYGASGSNRIPNAAVSLSTGQTTTADANGFYKITNLPPGPVTITATKSGYMPGSVSRTLVNGVTEWGSVKLTP